MVNKQLYQELLARLRYAVRRKRPELWENQTWMLHHDNAPAHAWKLEIGIRSDGVNTCHWKVCSNRRYCSKFSVSVQLHITKLYVL